MKYKSEALQVVHEMMCASHQIGAISDEKMREFDRACLIEPEPLNSEQIRAIREQHHLSQADFARQLSVSIQSLNAWERGTRKPNHATLKLLNIVKHKGIEVLHY